MFSVRSLRCCLLLMLCVSGCGQVSTESGRDLSSDELAATSDGQATLSENALAANRKIVYEAEAKLIVDDGAQAKQAIPDLVAQHGGYLADASIVKTPDGPFRGTWEARVPADQFDPFVDSLAELGTVEDFRQTALDVTAEFIDLEARLMNAKKLEQRILELLKTSESSLENIIIVEKELSRVTGEIERMTGQMRVLQNQIDLSTITITARELYDNERPRAPPTFVSRIHQAWTVSISALQKFGEAVVVITVFLAPWLLVLFVLSIPSVMVARIFRKRRQVKS